MAHCAVPPTQIRYSTSGSPPVCTRRSDSVVALSGRCRRAGARSKPRSCSRVGWNRAHSRRRAPSAAGETGAPISSSGSGRREGSSRHPLVAARASSQSSARRCSVGESRVPSHSGSGVSWPRRACTSVPRSASPSSRPARARVTPACRCAPSWPRRVEKRGEVFSSSRLARRSSSRWPCSSSATERVVSSLRASSGYCTTGEPAFSPISPMVSHRSACPGSAFASFFAIRFQVATTTVGAAASSVSSVGPVPSVDPAPSLSSAAARRWASASCVRTRHTSRSCGSGPRASRARRSAREDSGRSTRTDTPRRAASSAAPGVCSRSATRSGEERRGRGRETIVTVSRALRAMVRRNASRLRGAMSTNSSMCRSNSSTCAV